MESSVVRASSGLLRRSLSRCMVVVHGGNPALPEAYRARMGIVLKILAWTLGVVLVLVIAFSAWFFWMTRRSFPQTAGAIDVPGLSAPVTVVRDEHGIPNIYADTTRDLFFAQGYVHAQDRFWQMDFYRHVSAGLYSLRSYFTRLRPRHSETAASLPCSFHTFQVHVPPLR